MSDLSGFVTDRHGGTDWWDQASAVSAVAYVDRGLRALKHSLETWHRASAACVS